LCNARTPFRLPLDTRPSGGASVPSGQIQGGFSPEPWYQISFFFLVPPLRPHPFFGQQHRGVLVLFFSRVTRYLFLLVVNCPSELLSLFPEAGFFGNFFLPPIFPPTGTKRGFFPQNTGLKCYPWVRLCLFPSRSISRFFETSFPNGNVYFPPCPFFFTLSPFPKPHLSDRRASFSFPFLLSQRFFPNNLIKPITIAGTSVTSSFPFHLTFRLGPLSPPPPGAGRTSKDKIPIVFFCPPSAARLSFSFAPAPPPFRGQPPLFAFFPPCAPFPPRRALSFERQPFPPSSFTLLFCAHPHCFLPTRCVSPPCFLLFPFSRELTSFCATAAPALFPLPVFGAPSLFFFPLA